MPRSLKPLFLFGLVAILLSSTIQSASAAATIDNLKLDKKNPKIGDTVTWSLDADCGAEKIQQVFISLKDPLGSTQMIQNDMNVMDFKMGKIGTRGSFTVPLKITAEANPGTYAVTSVTLACGGGSSVGVKDKLDQISFDVQDTGQPYTKTQPLVEKIAILNQGEVKNGDVVKINLVAVGPGKINNVAVWLLAPDGSEIRSYYSQYGQAISGESSKRIDRNLEFQVDNDWQSGTYRISRIEVSGYQGIDLSNGAQPDNPNPANTTSSFGRNVTITYTPAKGQQIYGQPESGAVTQPNLSNYSFTVNNPTAVTPTPPTITNLVMPTNEASAGSTLTLQLDVDGNGAYITNVNANYQPVSGSGQGIYCSQGALSQTELFPTKIEKLVLKCQNPRSQPLGDYRLTNLSAQTTSCKLAPNVLYTSENQYCQEAPRLRNISYVNFNENKQVYTTPTVKGTFPNIIDGLPKLKITSAGPLAKPVSELLAISSDTVKVKYAIDPMTTCVFTSSQGSVSQSSAEKVSIAVVISALKPKSTVVLSGTCTAEDKAKVSFTDSFTTTLPAPPVLPTVTAQEADYDSILITLSDLNQPGIDYDVEVSAGSFVIAGDTLEITDLDAGESSVLEMTMTDEFGQSTSGVVGTFKAKEPPKLYPPVVTAVKNSKGNYTFSFKRLKDLTYSVKATNCAAKISGDSIVVGSLVPGKLATAYLNVSDKYGQKASVKFLTASVKK